MYVYVYIYKYIYNFMSYIYIYIYVTHEIAVYKPLQRSIQDLAHVINSVAI